MSNHKPEHYHGPYWKVVIELKRCATCERLMVPNIEQRDPFPIFHQLTLKAQLERINAVGRSRAVDAKDDPICVVCEQEGRARFRCDLCDTERSSNELKMSFGYPAEHLCWSCYRTVPAEQWDNKVEALEEDHMYDFC